MSAEETLIQVRKDKHRELNQGTYPLTTNNHVSNAELLLSDISYMIDTKEIRTTIDLNEAFGNGTRQLHGRVGALRKSGALTFIKLTDGTGSIQLVATRNNLPDYERLKLLDLGDIIEVAGEPVLTKTGERSLLLSSWTVLTKSHRPPPEKFAGIADQELKCRKRYLDLMSDEETRARFTVRSCILRGIRAFMEQHDFMEVETSTLNSISSGANAKPFTTHHNALDTDLYLRIAPELYLKRLLVGGFNKVYEIGRNYRNEGIDTRHNPEFTMMESYQAYGRFPQLIKHTKNLLCFVDSFCRGELSGFVLDYYKSSIKARPFSFEEFAEVTMFEAVIKGMRAASLDPDSAHSLAEFSYLDPENPRIQKIDRKAMMHDMDQCTTEGQRIAVLFEHVAEPFLAEDYRTEDGKYSLPVFITEYPKEICPLARANDKDPSVCDRFELFVEGRELANAFQELNDPDEQALRFKEQLASNNKDAMDYDADYVEALEHGMPPAIGFGMGIDRLVMLMTNATTIKDVILFPTLKPEK